MKTSLNIAKITPPRLPQVLERPRLIERLEQNQDKKLILILGQAAQGKSTLQAPWLGFTGFFVVAIMLGLLIFVGGAVRDAFDPRKLFAGAPPPEGDPDDQQVAPLTADAGEGRA